METPTASAGRRGTGFGIVPATEADVPDLIEMIGELARFEGLSEELEVTADSLRAAMFGRHPAAGALIARIGGEVAGYAVYYRTFSTFVGRPGIFLEDLYVRPSFRQGGLGRALLVAVARIGVALGDGRFEWIALRWNESALRFYRGLGARPMDDWALLRMNRRDVAQLLRTPNHYSHD
ncbi:MAG: GNAT family N-acetyltransferase [Verrucomicrobiales bacterium]|nr:GNAT family N-acetyltransferase [Verrucomicrobiales bacterium]